MAASVWKGHLIFGMVSFPIRLFSAARSETISFNLLHKDDHSRIRQVTYCALEDKPIPRTETVKKVAPKTAKVMEILEFVKADQVDPIYLESSYYVAPEEGGEKAYALLFTAFGEPVYAYVAASAFGYVAGVAIGFYLGVKDGRPFSTMAPFSFPRYFSKSAGDDTSTRTGVPD